MKKKLVVIGKCRCGAPAILKMRTLLSPTKATRWRNVCLACSVKRAEVQQSAETRGK